jgi:hypothetical protein
MPDDLSFTIDTRELDHVLSSLPVQLQKRILRESLQAAGDVILEAMVSLAPERTDEPMPSSTSLPAGILRADLQTDVRVSESSGARVRIGPGEIAGHVARWQNNGYNLTTHGRKRQRKAIRAIPGKHFIESAADEAGQAALDTLVEHIAKGLADAQKE